METIVGGGLAHYTEDLDRAMRLHAGPNQVLEGLPFTSPLLHAGGTRGRKYVGFLRKSALVKRCVQSLRRFRKQVPWPLADAWAERWRATPDDIVVVVPHVVINDEGKLDCYYAAIAGRTFVWVIHDLHALHFPDQWRDVDVQLLKKRFAFLGQSASQIIVHNEFTAQDVSEKLGIERSRISTVLLPSFFSESAFASSHESDEKCLASLDIKRPYALWASSSTYSHKNHERLLHAWRILADRGCSLQLVCTGSREPRWDQVSSTIQKLRLDSHVRFTGTISDAALAAVVRNAHLAICPTLFEGGGPGPAAEAMMAGIPLTVSDIPQCRQLFNMRTDLCAFFDPYKPEAIAGAVENILLDYQAATDRADAARTKYPMMRSWEGAASQYWKAVEAARQCPVVEL